MRLRRAALGRPDVSIRPRLWARGKPAESRPRFDTSRRFNPPPPVGTGETQRVENSIIDSAFQSAPACGHGGNHKSPHCVMRRNRFQSAPACGHGGNGRLAGQGRGNAVSIRPRLWARGKHGRSLPHDRAALGFQSAPACGHGGNPPKTMIPHMNGVSIRPRLWARGKRCRRDPNRPTDSRFQSAPACGHGGNATTVITLTVAPFQSAPACGHGGNTATLRISLQKVFQSAPACGHGGNGAIVRLLQR